MKAKSTFAARAQGQRKQLGLSCEQVAEKMRRLGFDNWTEWTVKGVENDKRAMKVDGAESELDAYAFVLDTDRDYLSPPRNYGAAELRPYLTAA